MLDDDKNIFLYKIKQNIRSKNKFKSCQLKQKIKAHKELYWWCIKYILAKGKCTLRSHNSELESQDIVP